MAVNYKVMARAEAGVPGGGHKKYYAVPSNSGKATIDDLIQTIEKTSTGSGADVHLVVYALIDAIEKELSNGRSVRLGQLGDIRLTFTSEGKDTPDEVGPDDIKRIKTIFKPAAKLQAALSNLRFVRIGS